MVRVVSVCLVLFLAACGESSSSSGSDPTIGSFVAAADPAPAPMDTTCNTAALSSGVDACQGPWSYTRWKTCEKRHLECKTECTKRDSCVTFRNGVKTGTRSFATTAKRVCKQKQKWVPEPDAPTTSGTWVNIPGELDCEGANTCPATAITTAQKNTIIGEFDDQLDIDYAKDSSTAAKNERKERREDGIALIAYKSTTSGQLTTTTTYDVDDNNNKKRTAITTSTRSCTVVAVAPKGIDAVHPDCDCLKEEPEVCAQQHPDCGTEPFFTKPGAARPEKTDTIKIKNAAGKIVNSEVMDVFTDQVCTSDDQAPFATATQARSKFDKLKARLDNPPALGDAAKNPAGQVLLATYKKAIHARLQLLVELRGHLLDATRRTTARTLYGDASLLGTCQISTGLSAGCLSKAKSASIYPRLQTCANLASRWSLGSTGDDKAARLLSEAAQHDDCLKVFDDALAVADSACRGELREQAASFAVNLMKARFSTLSWDGATFATLATVLENLDAWYERANVAAPTEGQSAAVREANLLWLRKKTEVLLTAFWTTANDVARALPSTIAAGTIEGELDSIAGVGMGVDLAVLEGIAGASVDSPPVIALFVDAFQAVYQRLETASELHDLACRYRACNRGGNVTSLTWRLLASLADRTQLEQAVQAANPLRTAGVSAGVIAVLDAFETLSTQTAWNRLDSAYKRDGNPGTLANLLDGGPTSPTGQRLTGLVATARERFRNYQLFGMFNGDATRTLDIGLQNTDDIIARLHDHLVAFTGAAGKYESDLIGLVQTLITAIAGDQEVAANETQTNTVIEQISQAGEQLDGLRRMEDSDRARWANMADDLVAAAEKLPDVEATLSEEAISVSGAHALFTDGGTNHPATIGVTIPDASTEAADDTKLWSRALVAGDVLRFAAKNEYQPSCALSAAALPTGQLGNLDAPDTGETYSVDTTDKLVGPEGYRMSFTGSEFKATGKERQASLDMYARVEMCVKTGADNGITKAFGAKFETWIQACVGVAGGVKDSYSGREGADQRTSASFSGGVHLDNTPFPDSPAGALLLVLVDAGAVVDVQVVGRDSAYVATRPGTAYLVVNDKSGCAQPVPVPALAVTIRHSTSGKALLGQIATAMGEALNELSTDLEAIIAQGQVVPAQDNHLRLKVRTKVQTATGKALTLLPGPLQEYIELWITAELTSLYRRIEIDRRENEIALALVRLRGLGRELELADQKGRLQKLLPRWQMRELAGGNVARERLRLYHYLRNVVPPIFELRYRAALADLLSADPKSAAVELAALEKVDFTQSPTILNKLLSDFANKVDYYLAEAVADNRLYGKLTVAVSFPAPSFFGTATPPAGCELFDTCPPSVPGQAPDLLWKTAELGRSEGIWRAIVGDDDGNHQARITITPADLYTKGSDPGQLPCIAGAPVIRKMMLYVVSPNALSLNYYPDVEIERSQLFPLPSGAELYMVSEEDDDWRVAAVPLVAGTEGNALSTLDSYPETSAFAGMSPFNTFTVNLESLADLIPVELIHQVVVVFDVDYRSVGGAGVGIPTCRPAEF